MTSRCLSVLTFSLLVACSTLKAATAAPNQLVSAVTGAATDKGIAVFVMVEVVSPYGTAAGFADFETKRPMTVDTPLRIASNTKTFTAASALRLVEQGKLELDKPMQARCCLPRSMHSLRPTGSTPTIFCFGN